MHWLTDPQAWIAFLTLTALEIVLGIDNVIFISILAGKLPAAQQAKARRLGSVTVLPDLDYAPDGPPGDRLRQRHLRA
jgi:predicted tellurium resistance membrane protein TerC